MSTIRSNDAQIRAYAKSLGVTPSGITDEFLVSVTFIDLKEVLDEAFRDHNQQAAIDWVIEQYGDQIKERLNEHK